MILLIELQDDDDVIHKQVQCEIHGPCTLDGLKDMICNYWLISPVHQELFFKNGEEIDDSDTSSIQSCGLKHHTKVVLRHSHISLWDGYKEYVDLVNRMQGNRTENAKQALEYCEELDEANFFHLYSSFDKIRQETHDEVAYWADEGIQMMKKATVDFFRRLHDLKRGTEDSVFSCTFEEQHLDYKLKPRYVIAFVQIHGENSITEYKIRCRTGARVLPDFDELYCYKLLSLIGVCPKSHIIPPSSFSGKQTSTYIAVQRDDNFESVRADRDENELCADVIVQLSMLEVLLIMCIEFHNTGGKYKGTKNAAIVEVYMEEVDEWRLPHLDIKQELLEFIRPWTQNQEMHSDNCWFNRAKVYLTKWDIPSKVELAREQLDPTGVLLANCDTMHDRLNIYIDKVIRNVERLQTALDFIPCC